MKRQKIAAAAIDGEHVERWLDLYRTGELDELDRQRVEVHLERCPDCTRKLAELETFLATVARGFEAERRSTIVQEPAWERQRREILEKTIRARPRGAWNRILQQYAPQAAMAAIALIVLGILFREGVRGPEQVEERLRSSAPAADEGESDFATSPREPETAAGARESERPSDLARSPGVAAPPGDADGEAVLEAEPAGPRSPAPVGSESRKRRLERAPETAPAQPAEAEIAVRADARDEPAAKQIAPPGEAAADTRPANGARERMAAAAPAVADEQFRTSAAAMDELQRLELYARRALARGDSLEAAQVLAFWRDSLAARTDLDPARKRAAAALVDSVATLVGKSSSYAK